MKHRNASLTILTLSLLFGCSFSYGKNNHSGKAEIKVFKEQNNQWTQIKTGSYDETNCAVLQLEYDSYYTIEVSDVTDLDALKNLAATFGANIMNKHYQLPLNQSSGTKTTGMEDYFTELPFALVSYFQKNVADKNVYIVLMKTKSKEMILN